MNKEQERGLEGLANEAAAGGMSRVTFIRRALALGLAAPAIAGALGAIEGPVPTGAASAPAQLTFGSWGSVDEQLTINQILKVFMQRHPNIQVQPQLTSFGDYFVKLNADLAAKSIPDVMFLTYVPTYASKGALQDIRAMARSHGKNLSAYAPGPLFLFEYNGGLYGLPRDNDTKVIFYNRKMLRAAGVPFPKNGWSWDDLRAAAKRLTKGSGARVSQYGFAYETGFWYLWLWQNGIEIFDNDAKPTRVTFDTPTAARTLQFVADLTTKDKVTPPATNLAGSATIAPLFAGGQLAMAFGNHALVPTFAKTPGLDWDVVGLPHWSGRPVVNFAGGAGYCMSKYTKSPDATYQLWDFLTGPVATLTFSEGNDVTPIEPGVLKSSFWRSKPYNAVFQQQTPLGHRLPSFPAFSDVYGAANNTLQPLWTGEGTAAQLVPKAVAAASKVLKSAK
jgi:multiple sugar transport system substrate-binding protein